MKCQGCGAFRLQHGHYWLLLAKFTVKIKTKTKKAERSKKFASWSGNEGVGVRSDQQMCRSQRHKHRQKEAKNFALRQERCRRTPQKSKRPLSLPQRQGCENANSFHRLAKSEAFQKRALGCPSLLPTDGLRICFLSSLQGNLGCAAWFP